jgi:glycosyltransferase involved in cell wall biosynthesis
MKKIKILIVGTDKGVLDNASTAQTRQIEYFKNFKKSTFLVLGVGKNNNVEKAGVRFLFVGGKYKITNFIKSFFKVYRLCKVDKYDIIYTQDVLYSGIIGFLIAKLFRISFVPQLHGDYLNNPLWIKQRFENIFLNKLGIFFLKHADKIRCVSNRILQQVVCDFGVDRKKVASLPIGIDGAAFNTNNALSWDRREKEILFVGRLIPEKEPLFFCDIVIPFLRKYQQFKVTIIGEGELQQEVRNKFIAAGLESRLCMPGFLKPLELSLYYKRAFVYIKTAFWEGWGLPMVESSACGLPCISTDTGCAGEVIIHEKNGLIIDSQKSQDFEVALERLVNDSDLYKQLCSNAAFLAKDWVFDTMKIKLENFLIDAVKK